MIQRWVTRLIVWFVLAWAAVLVGGILGGAVFGLERFHCGGGPGMLDDVACPAAAERTAVQLVGYIVGGGIRVGVGMAAVGYAPAAVFAVAATALEWVSERLGWSGVARLAPWSTLGIGAVVAVTRLIGSEFVNVAWSWVGLTLAVGVVASGIWLVNRLEIGVRADRAG